MNKCEIKIEKQSGTFKIYFNDLLHFSFPIQQIKALGIQSYIDSQKTIEQGKYIIEYNNTLYPEPIICGYGNKAHWELILKAIDKL